MDLNQHITMYVAGEVEPGELPVIAGEALVAGYDSPSLRILAGISEQNKEEAILLFEMAIKELGLQKPSKNDAALAVVRKYVAAIVQKSLTPYEGALQIWLKVGIRFPEAGELYDFKALSDEFEDDIKNREVYSQRILQKAEELLSKMNIGKN